MPKTKTVIHSQDESDSIVIRRAPKAEKKATVFLIFSCYPDSDVVRFEVARKTKAAAEEELSKLELSGMTNGRNYWIEEEPIE
jgi:hypothetical protein